MYEQTLASLADRYGKRIAYFQSLPIIRNLSKCYKGGVIPDAGNDDKLDDCQSQLDTSVCPIYEDGMSG